MNINLTLLGQILTFALFVWFTMKYVWPPITKALEQRQQKIADGIAAAEKSQHDLELAERKAMEILSEAKDGALRIVDGANKRAEIILSEVKEIARQEAHRIVAQAQDQVQQAVVIAREELRSQIGQLVVLTTEKILHQHIDVTKHHELINQALGEI